MGQQGQPDSGAGHPDLFGDKGVFSQELQVLKVLPVNIDDWKVNAVREEERKHFIVSFPFLRRKPVGLDVSTAVSKVAYLLTVLHEKRGAYGYLKCIQRVRGQLKLRAFLGRLIKDRKTTIALLVKDWEKEDERNRSELSRGDLRPGEVKKLTERYAYSYVPPEIKPLIMKLVYNARLFEWRAQQLNIIRALEEAKLQKERVLSQMQVHADGRIVYFSQREVAQNCVIDISNLVLSMKRFELHWSDIKSHELELCIHECHLFPPEMDTPQEGSKGKANDKSSAQPGRSPRASSLSEDIKELVYDSDSPQYRKRLSYSVSPGRNQPRRNSLFPPNEPQNGNSPAKSPRRGSVFRGDEQARRPSRHSPGPRSGTTYNVQGPSRDGSMHLDDRFTKRQNNARSPRASPRSRHSQSPTSRHSQSPTSRSSPTRKQSIYYGDADGNGNNSSFYNPGLKPQRHGAIRKGSIVSGDGSVVVHAKPATHNDSPTSLSPDTSPRIELHKRRSFQEQMKIDNKWKEITAKSDKRADFKALSLARETVPAKSPHSLALPMSPSSMSPLVQVSSSKSMPTSPISPRVHTPKRATQLPSPVGSGPTRSLTPAFSPGLTPRNAIPIPGTRESNHSPMLVPLPKKSSRPPTRDYALMDQNTNKFKRRSSKEGHEQYIINPTTGRLTQRNHNPKFLKSLHPRIKLESSS